MSKKKKVDSVSEWVHLVDVMSLGVNPMNVTLSASPEIRKTLLNRLGLVSMDRLEAELELERGSNSAVVQVKGRIRADIVQSCVVTLEPVETQIDEEFDAWFASPEDAVSLTKARHDRKLRKGHTETPILDESEDPEAIIEGKIDAGELVVQHLSLALDPYPHKEGVVYEVSDDKLEPVAAPGEGRKNPFAALKDWKNKLKQGDS